MLLRLLTTFTIIAMLWTGTLWHDFFGTQLLPRITNTSESFVDAADFSDLTTFGERCPSPEHLHSPWSTTRIENPAACILAVLSFVLPAERQFSVRQILLANAAPMRAPPEKLREPNADIYILNRALLI